MKNKAKILVVDDDPAMRSLLTFQLENIGYDIDSADSGEEVLEMLKSKFPYDLVISDMLLPGISGAEVLKHVKMEYSECQVIYITAYPSLKMGVEAIKNGAYDFIIKPFDMEQLFKVVANALESKTLKAENNNLRQALIPPTGVSDLIGTSKEINAVRQLIRQSVKSRATVLISGESGTGKEVVAKTIHKNSLLHKAPFIAVNCGAISANLIESELFGHEKGAFTGADKLKIGKFERANNGTIFLDEIGELPREAQVKFLRVLQEKEIVRVGGAEKIQLNIRVIAATNRNLRKMVQEGKFREDLYYRLALFIIDIPNLDSRGKDKLLLAQYFLDKNTAMESCSGMTLAKSANNFILESKWPGNVRQLDNCMHRTVLMNVGKTKLEKDDIQVLEPIVKTEVNGTAYFENEILPLSVLEANAIESALKITQGNVKKASDQLGISRVTLYRKMKEYNIEKTSVISS